MRIAGSTTHVRERVCLTQRPPPQELVLVVSEDTMQASKGKK